MTMTPIPFCSLGGYRRFSMWWWNDLLYYTLGVDFSGWLQNRDIDTFFGRMRPYVRWIAPGWCRDCYAFYHRGRYGWAPRDTWSLDHYLNRVMGSTLSHLAAQKAGAPMGYPYADLEKAPKDDDGPMTDGEQWQKDLQRWSAAFVDLHMWESRSSAQALDDFHNWSDTIALERAKYRCVQNALEEMAPWWGGLWD